MLKADEQRSTFTDTRTYDYAPFSRFLTNEQYYLASGVSAAQSYAFDLGTAKGLGVGDSGLAEAVGALREGIEQLRAPVVEIRDQIGKSELERLADEVKRTLYSMGYDQVAIRTDLASIGMGEGKAHVEVSRSGVKSKGYLVLRGGSVVETKISPTYEMFP